MTPLERWSPLSALKLDNRHRAGHFALSFLAIFAFAWAIARACVQSVVGDEGITYLNFVAKPWPMQWYPAANNHLLNTLLIQGFTSVFGLSALTLRAGALTGAAIYILSAYWLCRMISREWIVRLPLFICLVYNPYVFDFFVAARGYGLAVGFLLLAIAVAAWSHLESRWMAGCAIGSASIGLSFTANFSFAFADVAVLLMIFLWALKAAPKLLWKLLAAVSVPAILVVFLIPSDTLLHWPAGQLYIGVESVWKSIKSMIEATLYQMDASLVNPFLYGILLKLKRFLIPAFWIAVAFQISMIARAWPKLRSPENVWRVSLGAAAACAAALVMFIHWAALHLFGLLMPSDRTAVFFVPLVTLIAGSAAAVASPSRIGTIARRASRTMLVVMAAYFGLCMRLTYFHEWQYISEAKQAYFAAAYYNHARCAQDVFATWYYDGALEFYRNFYQRERFTPFITDTKNPAGHQIYIVNRVFDNDVIESQHLTVVYRGETTDVTVGLAPSIASTPARVCDAANLP
jgi:hypothetical protein